MKLSKMTKGVLGCNVIDLELDDRGKIVAIYLEPETEYEGKGVKVVARYESYTPCLEFVPVPDPEKQEDTEKEG